LTIRASTRSWWETNSPAASCIAATADAGINEHRSRLSLAGRCQSVKALFAAGADLVDDRPFERIVEVADLARAEAA
jgi:hypothetical protein